MCLLLLPVWIEAIRRRWPLLVVELRWRLHIKLLLLLLWHLHHMLLIVPGLLLIILLLRLPSLIVISRKLVTTWLELLRLLLVLRYGCWRVHRVLMLIEVLHLLVEWLRRP